MIIWHTIGGFGITYMHIYYISSRHNVIYMLVYHYVFSIYSYHLYLWSHDICVRVNGIILWSCAHRTNAFHYPLCCSHPTWMKNDDGKHSKSYGSVAIFILYKTVRLAIIFNSKITIGVVDFHTYCCFTKIRVRKTCCTNLTMRQSHISTSTALWKKFAHVCTFQLLYGVLWGACQCIGGFMKWVYCDTYAMLQLLSLHIWCKLYINQVMAVAYFAVLHPTIERMKTVSE